MKYTKRASVSLKQGPLLTDRVGVIPARVVTKGIADVIRVILVQNRLGRHAHRVVLATSHRDERGSQTYEGEDEGRDRSSNQIALHQI